MPPLDASQSTVTMVSHPSATSFLTPIIRPLKPALLALCGLALAILIPLGAMTAARRTQLRPRLQRQVAVGTFVWLVLLTVPLLLMGLGWTDGIWVLVGTAVAVMIFALARASAALSALKRSKSKP